jgi:2-dehydro-3-deoxygluconokinase
MTKRIVVFGEVMARLSPPLGEALGFSPSFQTWFGGAEANAAAAIAQLGGDAALVTTLPANGLGRGAKAALAARGIDLSLVRFSDKGRMGLYFATFGAGVQPAEVLYDRAQSAFALDPSPADMKAALAGAGYLHITGITPAVSPSAAEAALSFAQTAIEAGVKVSFDGNYRAKLWAVWGGDGPAILRQLMQLASIAFVDHRDIALVLGESFEGSGHRARNQAAYKRAFEVFPRLELICATERTVKAVSHHELAACAQARSSEFVTLAPVSLTSVVDRIGGGDAFAGAFLLAASRGEPVEVALRFALYAGAAKHGQRGDMLALSETELRTLMSSSSLDVQR